MSITDASELILPAKFVSNRGYQNMFSMVNVAPAGKSSQLTKSPIICATNMNEERCAYGMFNNCVNLSEITCLATDISGTRTTDNFSKSVAATGVFHKASSMNDWTIGVNGIPDGWSIDDATKPAYKYDWTGLYEWTQIADENGGGATYTAGKNISIDASNAISADGYVYNEANKTFLNVVKMTSSSLINKYSENGNKIGEGITESCAFGSRNVIQTSASHQEGETSSMNYAFGKGNTILGTRLTNIVCGTGNTLYGGNTAAVFGVGNYLAENVDRTNEVVVGLKLNATNTQEVALGLNNVSHTGTNNNEKTNLSIGTGVYLSSSNETHENLVETMKNGDIYIKGVGGYDGVHIKSETGYENTKTLQEYIAALEAKLAEYESRIAALEGNTTVE